MTISPSEVSSVQSSSSSRSKAVSEVENVQLQLEEILMVQSDNLPTASDIVVIISS